MAQTLNSGEDDMDVMGTRVLPIIIKQWLEKLQNGRLPGTVRGGYCRWKLCKSEAKG